MAAGASKAAKRFAAALLLLLVLPGLAGVLPMVWLGPSCGHDFDFHLQSWLAVKTAWQAHILAPIWAAAANYGAGEPRFVFYPPLSWLLGGSLGALFSLGLPGGQAWSLAPVAFSFIAIAGASASMYRLARRYTQAAPAILASALYALSPYLLFNAYERSAFAELLAAVWFPLLLGELLPAVAACCLQQRQIRIGRIAILLAALWYTNAPSGVMGCYLVLFTVVFVALRRTVAGLWNRSHGTPAWRCSASLAGSVVLGCMLSADYLFPAWYQQRDVAIARAVGPGMRVQDSFLFAHTGEPFHDQVLRTASWIVVATVGVALLSDLAMLKGRGEDGCGTNQNDSGIALFLVAVVLVCALLQFPWSLPLWHLLPEMSFLQFPWRLLLPITTATALLMAVALGRATTGGPDIAGKHTASARMKAVAILGMLYIGGMVFWTARTRYQPCDEDDRVPAQLDLLASSSGFEGTDEYALKGTDNGEIQRELPFVRLAASRDADEGDDAAADNPVWRPSTTLLAGTVRIDVLAPEVFAVRVRPAAGVGNQRVYALLRLERSADWQIELNGKACGEACTGHAEQREDGLLTVRIPSNAEALIKGHTRSGLHAPWDVWVGRGLTLVAASMLLLMRRRAAQGRTP